MKAIKINLFSMIEVAIAVVILAIGATAVVTLVPVGIKQKKDAMGENYSALFINDSQAFFSSLVAKPKDPITGKTGWEQLLALPYYKSGIILENGKEKTVEGVFDPNDPKQMQITSAQKGARVSTDLYATDVPGVYNLYKTSGSDTGAIEDYSGQVVVWRSIDTYSQDKNLGTVTTDDVTVLPPQIFNITSGTVSTTEASNVTMKCIASEFMDSSGKHYPVYYEVSVKEPNKAAYTLYPFGKKVAVSPSSAQWTLPNIPAGTTIVAKGSTDAYSQDSYLSTDSSHVKTLKNGDSIPTDVPFYKNQQSAAAVVKPYLGSDNKIKLDQNQVIYLFDQNPTGKLDFQDMVVVATLVPAVTSPLEAASAIKITPTDSSYSFELNSDTGKILDIATMNKIIGTAKKNKTGFSEADFIYPNYKQFSAGSLKMKVKSGDNAKINVDGEDVVIDNKDILLKSANTNGLNIKLWKMNSGKGGQWQIQILPSTGSGTIGGVDINPTGGTGGITVIPGSTTTYGVGVNVEISWPLSQTDYSKRSKLRYYKEYYDMPNI